MYLSGGVNATTNGSLSLAGNYVIWSARLRSPGYKGRNLAEWAQIKSYYAIMRETVAHKSICDHLNQDGDSRRDNKRERFLGATGGTQI